MGRSIFFFPTCAVSAARAARFGPTCAPLKPPARILDRSRQRGPSPSAARKRTQLAAAHAACRHAQPEPTQSVAARSLRPRALPVASCSKSPHAASSLTQPSGRVCNLLLAAACLQPACCLPAACLLPAFYLLPTACLLLAACCCLPAACLQPTCCLLATCSLPAFCLLPPTCSLPAACLLPAFYLLPAACLLLAACCRLPAACLQPACCLLAACSLPAYLRSCNPQWYNRIPSSVVRLRRPWSILRPPSPFSVPVVHRPSVVRPLLPACYLLPAAACLPPACLPAFCLLPPTCSLPAACLLPACYLLPLPLASASCLLPGACCLCLLPPALSQYGDA
ncbi:unnamed protein product [Closterium sp. NIES-54]